MFCSVCKQKVYELYELYDGVIKTAHFKKKEVFMIQYLNIKKEYTMISYREEKGDEREKNNTSL
jgi:hypothetical protein